MRRGGFEPPLGPWQGPVIPLHHRRASHPKRIALRDKRLPNRATGVGVGERGRTQRSEIPRHTGFASFMSGSDTNHVDILLHLKAEESRAVGVSGLTVAPNSQSVRICRAVHGLWRVGLLGVPSPRYSSPPSYRDSWCCFCHGSPTDFNGLGVTFCGACKQSGTASVHCRNRPFT